MTAQGGGIPQKPVKPALRMPPFSANCAGDGCIKLSHKGTFGLQNCASLFKLEKRPHAKGHHMYFGVDYHPEQWVYPYGGTADDPEAAWKQDIKLMAEAGINVVRIGEFTWGLCEPEEGKYDFGWLRRVMDLLGKAGIEVVLATPT